MLHGTPSALRVRRARVLSLAALLLGCDGNLVNLGASSLTVGGAGSSGASSSEGAQGGSSSPPRFQPPVLLLAQEEGVLLSNPSLPDDERTLYYTEQNSGDDEPVGIYRRALQAGSWTARTELVLGGTTALDASSPVISGDGAFLWFGQNVAAGLGGTDMWLSRAQGDAWSEPENLGMPANSSSDDAPRAVAVGATLMPLSSRRHGGPRYQIYLASRSSPGDPWQAVSQDSLARINSESFASVDGFLTEDGLSLYFASTRHAQSRSDLFIAQRRSLQEPFGEPLALEVNTSADERSPWLGKSGALYFTSDRPTSDYQQYAIYRSDPVRP